MFLVLEKTRHSEFSSPYYMSVGTTNYGTLKEITTAKEMTRAELDKFLDEKEMIICSTIKEWSNPDAGIDDYYHGHRTGHFVLILLPEGDDFRVIIPKQVDKKRTVIDKRHKL